MSCLYFGISGAAVDNVVVVENGERRQGNLIKFPRKTSDAGVRGEFIKATNAIRFRGEANENGLHEVVSLLLPD
jgi:hypothetical protein